MGNEHPLYASKGRASPLCLHRPIQPLCGMLVNLEHRDIGMVLYNLGCANRRAWCTGDTKHGTENLHRVFPIRNKGKDYHAKHAR